MIRLIQQSRKAKMIAMLLAFSILTMSFRNADEPVVLQAGTPLELETASVIDSGTVKAGSIVMFRVRQDVRVGDKVVVKAGASARGQVIRVDAPKGLGKPGRLDIQIKSVTAVDGQEVLLMGNTISQEGEDKSTLAIVLGVVVCILFLTMKGKSAIIQPGYTTGAAVASNATIDVN